MSPAKENILEAATARFAKFLKKKGKQVLVDLMTSVKVSSGAEAEAPGGEVTPEDLAALETIRHAQMVDPARPPVVAVVGVTKAGKSRLLCQLFGDQSAFLTKASIDTTDKLFRSPLPNGLVVMDSPGVGGENDRYENITRSYMGLSQVDSSDALDGDGELQRVTQLPVCSVGNQVNCPLRERIPCTIDGKDEEQLAMPLAFEKNKQKVYRRYTHADGSIKRSDPVEVVLLPCDQAESGKPCRYLGAYPLKDGIPAEIRPDVVIVLTSGPRGGFHRLDLRFVRQLQKQPGISDRLVFAVNMWQTQPPQARMEVLSKVEEQLGEPAVAVDAATGAGVKDLVALIARRLPGETAEKFNAALVESLRRERESIVGDHILRMAVRAGIAHTDAEVTLPDSREKIPEFQQFIAHLLGRLADIHRIPDAMWNDVGGDYQQFVETAVPEVIRKSGMDVEYVDSITVPEVREKKVRVPRRGFFGWVSRTFVGELFGMEQYDEDVRQVTVNVTKKIKTIRTEPGRGGPGGIRMILEVGLDAHWRFMNAARGNPGNGQQGSAKERAATLVAGLGEARLREICNEANEKRLMDYMVEHLPENWLAAR